MYMYTHSNRKVGYRAVYFVYLQTLSFNCTCARIYYVRTLVGTIVRFEVGHKHTAFNDVDTPLDNSFMAIAHKYFIAQKY